MRGLLFIGGDFPICNSGAATPTSSDIICAADSGLEQLSAYNILPHIVVGDMDSLRNYSFLCLYTESRWLLAPREKDLSDTELGILALQESGAENIVIIGGGGGMQDHAFAIKELFERKNHPQQWHTKNESIYFVASSTTQRFSIKRGQLVSIFSLSKGAESITTKGLQWNLHNLHYHPGDYSLHNRAIENEIDISICKGSALLFINSM